MKTSIRAASAALGLALFLGGGTAGVGAAVATVSGGTTAGDAPRLTLRGAQRPEWLRRDGIVMAGSWEPLLFRVRRDGGTGYTPTAEQRAAYAREHSPETIAKLKALGVNFVMMHCYKGGGLDAERESMADAVKFAQGCREAGLRVGCYTYSGAFIWELFFAERPAARDWLVHNEDGSPMTYGKAQYRYFWNRNHPDAAEFYRGIVRFAIEEIRPDLIHLDNHTIGPGYDANSVARFREYLRTKFSPAFLRENGIPDAAAAHPPRDRAPSTFLARAWADFCAQSLADSFHAMTRYARTLRPDILMETNPAGIDRLPRWAVDHGRLLRGGEAFWDEARQPGFANGALVTRIRTYKAARGLDNAAFAYVTTPLEAAESMAFNLDCLGAICWFEYGELVRRPGFNEPLSAELPRFVEFFHRRRDLLRDARVVSDVGVFRSHPSLQFGPPAQAKLTGAVEDRLIASRGAFQLVFDQQIDELARWPVLVLAGCVALSDVQVNRIREYVGAGGRLCVIGPLATHDEWMLPRRKPALADLPGDRVVRVGETADWWAAIRQARGGPLSLVVSGAAGDHGLDGLCTELTEQPSRRLVHLVNYRPDHPAKEVAVRVAVPAGRTAKSVVLASPERTVDRPVAFEHAGGQVAFTVPSVGVYEIAIVNY